MTKSSFAAQVSLKNFCWDLFGLNQVHSLGKVGQYASNVQVGKITGKYIFEKYITSRYLRILYNVQVNAYLKVH